MIPPPITPGFQKSELLLGGRAWELEKRAGFWLERRMGRERASDDEREKAVASGENWQNVGGGIMREERKAQETISVQQKELCLGRAPNTQ